MSQYFADVRWQRGDAVFSDSRYSRAHSWHFDGGAVVAASSSPHSVPLPLSDPAGVDPEEAFVAALSSCHMLWFLAIAAQRGYRIDDYRDQAVGALTQDERGRWSITQVVLRPRVQWSGEHIPSSEQVLALHHAAHEACYIAHSVRADVRCEPQES